MKSMKSLAMIACLGLVALGASPAQAAPPTPLKVTLSLLNPCPISLDQSLDLRAQITGGYHQGGGLQGFLPVVTRYSFYAQSAGGPSIVIKQDTPDTRAGWVPKLPGYYAFSVIVKQTQGGGVAQATAELPGGLLGCEVKKVMYGVTLNVSPPSGQAEAPPQSAAKRLTLSASVSNSFGNPSNDFGFMIRKMGGGGGSVVALGSVRTSQYSASWTPLDPPQPADPGLYTVSVTVRAYQTSPQGDVLVAEGMKEINYYEAKAATHFGNVNVLKGDPTVVKPPPAGPSGTPPVSLTVTPSSPGKMGNIAMTATLSVPGDPSAVTNKFTFSYISLGYVGQSASYILQTNGGSLSWTLSPQPPPGRYNLVVATETRRFADNALLAQASGQIANYVVTAEPTLPYGWLFPVTTQNTTLAVGAKYGSATNTIAGNSISEIVNNPGVRVRADNTACAQCHSGPPSKDYQCILAYNYVRFGGPHSTGQPADQTLGSIFADWKGRNCPN
jgi:hypothetical protein